MKLKLSATSIRNLQPKEKPYEVRDTDIKGFVLRVQPTGVMVYYLDYRVNGKRNRFRIGTHGTVTPAQARDVASDKSGDVAHGVDLQIEKKRTSSEVERERSLSLQGFIDNKYGPWVETHHRRGKDTLSRLKRCFEELLPKNMTEITPWVIEKWRSARIKSDTKQSTINRDIVVIKAALSKAVEWGLIDANPIARVKPARIDSSAVIRYLSEAEEKSLRDALDAREDDIRNKRESANRWRKDRNLAQFPLISNEAFADHLKPMALLSLNTGLRRGELFQLKWGNVDLQGALLTVVGETAKSGKTRHVPLNSESLDVLKKWNKQSKDKNGLVFPSKTGGVMDNIQTAWEKLLIRAGITEFRWHDLRHNFASKLVMAGVDLNTVRELLGHGDIKMTLRYAHLAPEHKAAAVARLVNTQ